MTTHRTVIGCLIVFAALSVTDFVQTYALIRHTNGTVYEANPVAAVWLDRFGWAGLAMFKAGTVAILMGAVALMARRSGRAAARVAALGCAALLFVSLHSRQLLATMPVNEQTDPCERQVVAKMPRFHHVNYDRATAWGDPRPE